MRGLDTRAQDPFEDSARDELGAVVAAHMPWGAMHADELAQDFDDATTANRSGDIDGQTFARVLVDDREALELLAICAGVEDEVIRPDVIALEGR